MRYAIYKCLSSIFCFVCCYVEWNVLLLTKHRKKVFILSSYKMYKVQHFMWICVQCSMYTYYNTVQRSVAFVLYIYTKLILVQCFRWHETTLRVPLQYNHEGDAECFVYWNRSDVWMYIFSFILKREEII